MRLFAREAVELLRGDESPVDRIVNHVEVEAAAGAELVEVLYYALDVDVVPALYQLLKIKRLYPAVADAQAAIHREGFSCWREKLARGVAEHHVQRRRIAPSASTYGAEGGANLAGSTRSINLEGSSRRHLTIGSSCPTHTKETYACSVSQSAIRHAQAAGLAAANGCGCSDKRQDDSHSCDCRPKPPSRSLIALALGGERYALLPLVGATRPHRRYELP